MCLDKQESLQSKSICATHNIFKYYFSNFSFGYLLRLRWSLKMTFLHKSLLYLHKQVSQIFSSFILIVNYLFLFILAWSNHIVSLYGNTINNLFTWKYVQKNWLLNANTALIFFSLKSNIACLLKGQISIYLQAMPRQNTFFCLESAISLIQWPFMRKKKTNPVHVNRVVYSTSNEYNIF